MVEEQRGNVGHDSKNPYSTEKKYKQPTYCPNCELVYTEGRWTEGDIPNSQQAHKKLCPACRRERDKVPDGIVHLKGQYLSNHQNEILNIVKNCEKRAQSTRPLQRIMSVNKNKGSVEITTTSEHLARRIGKSIHNAHQGDLNIASAQDERLVRIYWKRED